MAESWTRARLQASPEIPHTRVAGDTRGFAENGIGHNRQDGTLGGMLATARMGRSSRGHGMTAASWTHAHREIRSEHDRAEHAPRISSDSCVSAVLTFLGPKNDF